MDFGVDFLGKARAIDSAGSEVLYDGRYLEPGHDKAGY